ncbi:hypothetical protein GCK72_015949 [Caenorhabditis remanei]|uniref:Uncharacterized protein n=1 Tax=Caenorhabditis remanei TaxID=31234 RepID=A0A6A5GYW0_CAERE|nr:hypothetical protein GCK72_015949 [Caenorhabditis remanei]KAF1759482.1 hypothetical protein GCK72_015949 [Caenorhabditis remanei]
MIRLGLFLSLLSILTVSGEFHKMKLGGDCEKLRVELESSDTDAATKLSKLNAFLDTLGADTRQKFWDIVAAAKTDASTNLPSETAKNLAASVIADFEAGNLFRSHQELSKELKSKFESLDDADKTAVKNLAKVYGKQIKALVMPLLPSNCKATSEAAQEAGAQMETGGFDNGDYMPRKKRELLFIDHLTSAIREVRSRRGF